MSEPITVLIAKYVPDLFRNEPRNIGLVLWAAGRRQARFLGESITAPGTVAVQSIPRFIHSAAAYTQWVRYWQRQVQAANHADSALSLEGLLKELNPSPDSNYYVVVAGELNEAEDDWSRLLDDLMKDYVAEQVAPADTARQKIRALMRLKKSKKLVLGK